MPGLSEAILAGLISLHTLPVSAQQQGPPPLQSIGFGCSLERQFCLQVAREYQALGMGTVDSNNALDGDWANPFAPVGCYLRRDQNVSVWYWSGDGDGDCSAQTQCYCPDETHARRWAEKRTTPMIEQVFKGRCVETTALGFQQAIKAQSGLGPDDTVALCTSRWDNFRAAVSAGNDHDAWKRYFDQDRTLCLTRPSTALFWSGTARGYPAGGGPPPAEVKNTAHELSSLSSMTTIEGTLAGYMVNELRFCRSPTTGDFGPDCVANTDHFWHEASAAFARSATGHVRVLVGSGLNINRTAFRNNSYFATDELVNLNTQNVTSFEILVIRNALLPHERCGSGTLVQMVETVRRHFSARPDFEIACRDDPEEVLHILCVSDDDGHVGGDGLACSFARTQISNQQVHVRDHAVDVSWVAVFFAVSAASTQGAPPCTDMWPTRCNR